MSGKEEEHERFIPVLNKRDAKKGAKTLRGRSPTPNPAIPDTIGGTINPKKSSSKKSKQGDQTTSGTTATKTSEDVLPEKIHSDEQIAQTEPNESEGDQNEQSVMSPAPPAVFSSASPAPTSKRETLPNSNSTRKGNKAVESQQPAALAKTAINFESEDRRIGGKVLRYQGTTGNFSQLWGKDPKTYTRFSKDKFRVWGLDMVERQNDGTLVFPGSVPPLRPITKLDDIAEYLWEINCHLRPDLFGTFEPLEHESRKVTPRSILSMGKKSLEAIY